MALTAIRAFGALTGRRYGSFAGRVPASHPVDRLTQVRSFGTHVGRRYGSFDRAPAEHPVDRLTQIRAFGTHTGRRYGSFAGRGDGSHPVDRLTQIRAFGTHVGGLYGSFEGRDTVIPPEPPEQDNGIAVKPYPRRFPLRRGNREELMVVIAAFLHMVNNE